MKPWLTILDPIESLETKLDTSLYISNTAIGRGVVVYFATEHDLQIVQGAVWVRCRKVIQAPSGQPPSLESETKKKLTDFGLIFIRKDPPFDSAYVKLCWLVGTAAKKSLVLNPPEVLLRYHEKMLPLEGVAQGFLKKSDIAPTFLNAPLEASQFLRGESECVTKPFLGHGGRGVEKVRVSELERLAHPENVLIQPFLPEVQTVGDFRVLFGEGKVLGCFSRIPKKGEFLSNIARGGSAELRPLSASQKRVLERLGKFLKKLGVFLAGADLIGNHVSEVNITSPSGVRLYFNLTGTNVAERLVDFALARLKRR